MANKYEHNKVQLYMPDDVLSILDAACAGMDRTRSWMVQQAIKEAVPAIARRYFKIIEENDNDAP